MSSENGQTGPTQVHPVLNFNELTHINVNGLNNGMANGMNGLGMLGNQKFERGKLNIHQTYRNSDRIELN